MRNLKQRVAAALAVCLTVQSINPQFGQAADAIFKIVKTVKRPFEAVICREKPPMCKDKMVQELARQIDWLEHHIDAYGSIVAKQPDVWGESRLTHHREEFEQQMLTQLTTFHPTLQGALKRSDQAYLSMALAVQAAATGSKPASPTDMTTSITNLSAMLAPSATVTPPTTVGGPVKISDPSASGATVYGTAPFATAPGTGTDLTFGTSPTLSLEPTIMLDQMANYLRHLQELRRMNEGDDTADSPGYALDLVRIPVSILPGKHTRRGFGAEITVTATPYLTSELLPTTFRNLVIKDVVDLLAPIITLTINNADNSSSDADVGVVTPPTAGRSGRALLVSFQNGRARSLRAMLADPTVTPYGQKTRPRCNRRVQWDLSDGRSDSFRSIEERIPATEAVASP